MALTQTEMMHIARTRAKRWRAVVEYYERVGDTERLPIARIALKQCLDFLKRVAMKRGEG